MVLLKSNNLQSEEPTLLSHDIAGKNTIARKGHIALVKMLGGGLRRKLHWIRIIEQLLCDLEAEGNRSSALGSICPKHRLFRLLLDHRRDQSVQAILDVVCVRKRLDL